MLCQYCEKIITLRLQRQTAHIQELSQCCDITMIQSSTSAQQKTCSGLSELANQNILGLLERGLNETGTEKECLEIE